MLTLARSYGTCRRLRRRAYPLVLVLFLLPAAGFCADSLSDFPSLFEAEIVAYKSGNYQMSLECGIYALKLQPRDAFARYLLASSLAKLKRKDEAIKQFKQAAALTQDEKLRSYIKVALDDLVAPTAKVAPKLLDSDATVTAKSGQAKPTVADKELSEAQEQALAQSKIEIEARRKEADRDIARIHEEEAVQLSGIEQYRWKETEEHGRIEKVYEQSPAYTSLFEKLKKENEPRISEINERYNREKEQIEKTAKLRSDAYADAYSNEQTQLKMGNGLSQVAPIGSNLYVRNIINYGTENRLPELKARPQSLEDVTEPTSTKSPTNVAPAAK